MLNVMIELQQVFSIVTLRERDRSVPQIGGRDPAVTEGNAFRTGNQVLLAFLYVANEFRRAHQRLRCARIEPREAATELLDRQHPAREVCLVQIGYLKFTAGRWRQFGRQPWCVFVVNVKPGNRPVGLRYFWLLGDGGHLAERVKACNAIAMRVLNLIREHRCATAAGGRRMQDTRQVWTVEDVVTQDQDGWLVLHELRTDEIG